MALRGVMGRIVPMGLAYMGSGGAMLAASASQLLTFAILARYLGVEQFGLYAAITALTTLATQICGLGSQESLVRRVAQDRTMFPRMLGHTVILSAGSAALLVAIGMAVLPLLFPVSPDPMTNLMAALLILLTNIVLLRAVLVATQSFIAHSDFRAANTIEVLFAIVRTGAAVLGCMVFGVATVADWAAWHFASHLMAAAGASVAVLRLGWPVWTIVRDEIRLGVLFSTQFIFKAVRQNADILVLSAVASAEVLGSYSIARRILDNSYLAVEALNRLIYPGSAAASAGGLHNTVARVRKVLLAASGIGVGCAVAVFVCAPLLPILFGPDYVSLVGFTRILCWVVIPIAVYSVAMEALGAAGQQGARALIFNTANLGGAALVAAMTLWMGISGTFMAYYVVEIGIVVAGWWTLVRFVAADRAREAGRAVMA